MLVPCSQATRSTVGVGAFSNQIENPKGPLPSTEWPSNCWGSKRATKPKWICNSVIANGLWGVGRNGQSALDVQARSATRHVHCQLIAQRTKDLAHTRDYSKITIPNNPLMLQDLRAMRRIPRPISAPRPARASTRPARDILTTAAQQTHSVTLCDRIWFFIDI